MRKISDYIEKNQLKLTYLSFVVVSLLTIHLFLPSILNYFILIIISSVLLMFKVKSSQLYIASLILIIVLPLSMFFFPNQKINEYLGNITYLFLAIGVVKQIISVWTKNEVTD